jgi:O-antigen ligase
MLKLSNIKLNKITALSMMLVVMLVVGLFLFFIGAATALLPQFVARLILIPIFLALIAFAFLSKSKQDLTDPTLKLWLLILLATMALWPTYFIIKVGGLPSIEARRIVAGLTMLATLYFVISRESVRFQFKGLFSGYLGVGTLLISGYALLRIASCFVSIAPFSSLILVLWEVLFYYSMFFVGAILFNKKHLQDWVVKIMLILALLISLYSGVEWVMKKNILMQIAPVSDGLSMFQKALAISRVRDGFFRAQGTFEHPLVLAEFAAMSVCFGLSTLLWKGESLTYRLLGFSTFIAALITAFLTGSRSPLLTIAVSTSFIFILWIFANDKAREKSKTGIRKLMAFSTFSALMLLALPVFTLLIKGSSKLEETSSSVRIYMLKLGWEGIKANPILGTGPGTSGSVAGILSGSGVSTLDNYFLAIAIESGVPALILLLATLLFPVWFIFNQLMSDDTTINRSFLSAVMGLLIVTVLMHAILWMPYNLFFAFIFIGMALASMRVKK